MTSPPAAGAQIVAFPDARRVRTPPPPPKKHRWDAIGRRNPFTNEAVRWKCRHCGRWREDRSTGWTLYAYYEGGRFIGSSPPSCEGKPWHESR